MNTENFNNWRWQISNNISSIKDLNKWAYLTDEQNNWLNINFAENSLPFSVTPYFASLIKKELNCAILKQIIPIKKELINNSLELRDPLGEEPKEKVPHLIHRYPDRVLFLLSDRCASYCRFCTRKRFVAQGPSPKKSDYENAFSYIEKNTQIKEIIFSGGEPLLVNDDTIYKILTRAFLINNIQVVRFHSRMLSFAPMRITKSLCEIFKKFSPIYLVTHFNHPTELTDLAISALHELSNAGVVILNQSVLLANINDETYILEELFRKLIKNKVRPYYLHQCDLVTGASHFRVPIKKSLELIKSLRGHISGICMPTFIIDIPGGIGKVPIVPDPIVKEDENFIYLEGFNGEINSYPKN